MLFFPKMMEASEIYLDYAKITKYWKEALQPATLRGHLKSVLPTLLGTEIHLYIIGD